MSLNAGGRTWARIASARGAFTDDNDVTPRGQTIELVDYPDSPATPSHQSHAPDPRPTAHTQLTDRPAEDRLQHRGGIQPTLRKKPVRIKYWIEALRRHSRRHDTSGSDKMKFSHSLQFNAVPDWSAYYLAYSNLKKLYVRSLSSVG